MSARTFGHRLAPLDVACFAWVGVRLLLLGRWLWRGSRG